MKTGLLSLLFITVIFTACCTTNSSSVSDTEKSLAGSTWYLTKIYQASGNLDVTDKVSFIKFDAGKMSAGGNGGCNSFGSNYTIDNTSIGFKNIFSTKMFCEEKQQQENLFFSQLEKADRYLLKANRLSLYLNNQPLLEFEK